MGHDSETMIISWCDNGSADSAFMFGMLNTVMSEGLNIKLLSATVTNGNRIDHQRQIAIENWERIGSDWILWVDSDVIINADVVNRLLEVADKDKAPVVCGVYFIHLDKMGPLVKPVPCIFTDNGDNIAPIHPLPNNQVIPIDVAGMGLVLMHKSILPKLRAKYPDGIFFDTTVGEHSIAEDISFFRKVKEVGIQTYAHTGVKVPHIKRFFFDEYYYNLWWETYNRNNGVQ